MKRFLVPLAALAICPATVNAASTDTTRVALVIPVSCGVDVVGESVSANRLTLTLHRRCNTWHVVRVDSVGTPDEPATLRFNQVAVSLAGGSATLPQDERYFDGYDTLIVDMNAPAEDLERYASSLRFTIEQA